MMTLVLKLSKGADANQLMLAALSVAEYKKQRYYSFKGMKSPSDYNDYSDVHLPLYEPQWVWDSPSASENYRNGVEEYTVPAYALDVYLMDVLSDLQTVIPFEMHFENRGKFEADDWSSGGIDFEIYDDAIYTLYNTEPKSA